MLSTGKKTITSVLLVCVIVLHAAMAWAQASASDRGYVIVHGRIEYQGGSREDLSNNELIHKLYMGL